MKTTKRRILVVDDDAALCRTLQAGLRLCGFEVKTENNPAHVSSVARAFRPDLILLDVAMPGMDGGSVAQAMKDQKDLAQIPIIFLTALCSKQDTARAKNNGEVFLAKPISVNELVKNIEERLVRA
jgi:two-component system OmpR family response regulator